MASDGINSVENIKLGGKWCRLFTIRELFCYRHPTHGYIVKKSYAEKSIMTKGRAPTRADLVQKLIEGQKRNIEAYNTKVTAPGARPITEFWWEAPGMPGRYDDDGNPV
jgi:hypothetical protein